MAPAKLRVFEANRISEIITLLPNVRWKYLPSAQNPADCATKGMSAKLLQKFSLWWFGPPWLNQPSDWPDQLDLNGTKLVSLSSSIVEKPVENSSNWLKRFRSFNKLVRVMATCLRWRHISKSRATKMSLSLSAEEMKEARLKILRYDQSQFFGTEIRSIRANKLIPRKSKIGSLRPFLDEEKILRARSRTENASYLTYNEKYPIILDRRSEISKMIAQD